MTRAATATLIERTPSPTPEELLSSLVPPPQFAGATFASYVPDPGHPSQAAALRRVVALAQELAQEPRRRLRRRADGRGRREATGLYLDGGYGVGKTHLLAALAHAVGPERAAYGTFVEYTHLVGALGFAACVEALSRFRMIGIDEFELDDPGDTLIMSRLLRELTDRGVRPVATSNTLPEALGAGRFAAEDFLREIQALAGRFEVLRIDGEDYRHRAGLPTAAPLSDAEAGAAVAGRTDAIVDAFDDVVAHLARIHPSRYGALVDGVRALALTGAHPVDDDMVGLRLVVLVDRLYDRDVPVRLGGTPAAELFSARMLAGGYRKKYYRALSRLGALTARSVR